MKRSKLTFLFIALVFAVTIVMAQEPTATLDFDHGKTATEVLQKYVTAIQNADAEGVATLMTEDAMVYGLVGGLDSLNTAQHKAYWVNSLDNFKHSISNDLYLPVKVENNWNEGEWLQTWGINTLTNNRTGKTIPVPYHIASSIVGNKISTVHYYLDYANLLTKQGYKLTPHSE